MPRNPPTAQSRNYISITISKGTTSDPRADTRVFIYASTVTLRGLLASQWMHSSGNLLIVSTTLARSFSKINQRSNAWSLNSEVMKSVKSDRRQMQNVSNDASTVLVRLKDLEMHLLYATRCAPCTTHHILFIMHDAPSTTHHAPCTMRYPACIMHYARCTLRCTVRVDR